MSLVAESHVEEACFGWLADAGWQIARGPNIDPEMLGAERDDFREVVSTRCLTAALERINPELAPWAIEHAVAAVLRVEFPRRQSVHRCQGGPQAAAPRHRVVVNGLPLGVMELKNRSAENASAHTAFKQFQTYKQEIPTLFHANELLVVSDEYCRMTTD